MSSTYFTKEEKELVAQRASYCCEYCLSQLAFSSDSFSIDHIIPQFLKGENSPDNYAFACLGCNGRKAKAITARDPVDGRIVTLYHPRQHRWQEHFVWSEDFSLILGLTAMGRATVAKLALNRAGVVNLRTALRRIDKHPPF